MGSIKKHDVEINVESPGSSAALWYLLLFAGFMIGFMIVAYFLRQARGQGGGGGGSNIFGMGKSKARLFMPSTIKEKFSSVAGADGAKEELQDVIDYLKDPKKYQRLGAKITRGILLIGEPGNGKTLLAKAVAGEANCPFFSISGSDFIEVFVGVGAARVRDLFAQARKHSPCIIFIDEIDKIATGKKGGGGADVSREGVQRDLLPIVEGSAVNTKYGIIQTDHVLFVAAGAFHVAKPSDLIPELQGRFPIRVELSSLTEDDFYQILKEPKNALTKQYEALMDSEDVSLEFTDDSLRALAQLAFRINEEVENIGARRLHTVMSKLLNDILFDIPEEIPPNAKVVITKEMVGERLDSLVQDKDLSEFIL